MGAEDDRKPGQVVKANRQGSGRPYPRRLVDQRVAQEAERD